MPEQRNHWLAKFVGLGRDRDKVRNFIQVLSGIPFLRIV